MHCATDHPYRGLSAEAFVTRGCQLNCASLSGPTSASASLASSSNWRVPTRCIDRIASVPTPAHLALAPQLNEFRRQFEELANDADALVGPLSDAQFSWQPLVTKASADRPRYGWSVAQCIDHLNATARMYLPVLDEGIANAIRQGQYGEGPYTYWSVSYTHLRAHET